ncbi:hypothetical protein SAMN05216251_101234 [Actinacidiphila alni]|uniref:Carboxypeptidase regulatory-like domain-containing protein n=1 Tax=Actinacidiphila alni TaxID=380248 RepID=A0A1I1XCA6_9ACTN|nr:carboxypeptidase-like regulatory domain-containing protein [Actinacidiphila alni]SFE03353.1 hypothetical protein SAMN05216251_101234 [Actinacidiphila alni]
MWTINPTYESFGIDASDDGSSTWTSVRTPDLSGAEYIALDTHRDFPVGAYAGKPHARFRFHYVARGGWYWGIDNVFIGQRDFLPTPGGLAVGTVSDRNTGQGAVDATVTDKQDPAERARTTATPEDPAVADGYYSLFVPGPGTHVLTATRPGYTAAPQPVRIRADRTATAVYRLKAGQLELSPGSVEARVGPGQHTTRAIAVTNIGRANADLLIGEEGVDSAGIDRGAPLQRISGTYPIGHLTGKSAGMAPSPGTTAQTALP